MNILITGGAGFIGSHLAERLLNDGFHVTIIDDLSTGSATNIDSLKANKNFDYYFESIFNESLLRELIDKTDVIFHLAAAVGVFLIVESPVRTIETNVFGTELVLKYASLKKKRVIITSTSEVYGKANKIPFNEEDDLVLGPTTMGRWSYACSKALDEYLSIAYWREKKVPITIMRMFNTVGPRQSPSYGMVIPRFVIASLENKPIPVFGDGLQSRCFTYVDDAVDALILSAFNDISVGKVYNIGNPEEVSIRNLALLINEKVGSHSRIEFIPYSKAYGEGFEDMQRRVPDIKKISHDLGFQPKHSLESIIDRTVEYFRKMKNSTIVTK
ncbi:MAG: GDP-mannose 4,6-dehydratase [Bacteroidetes bacterium]|nr:GDP-mannose 4,6-dehydratase [Bacteroidota bacterium]